jgi:hypothetical protein
MTTQTYPDEYKKPPLCQWALLIANKELVCEPIVCAHCPLIPCPEDMIEDESRIASHNITCKLAKLIIDQQKGKNVHQNRVG